MGIYCLPYPVAYGEKNIYLLIESHSIPNDSLRDQNTHTKICEMDIYDDSYRFLYDNKDREEKESRSLKLIAERILGGIRDEKIFMVSCDGGLVEIYYCSGTNERVKVTNRNFVM